MRPITRPPMACIQAWPSKSRNLHRRSSDSGARSATAASGCSWAHCSTCIRLRRYRPSIFLPAMDGFTPFLRTPPAVRSRLELALSCVRRGRAGAGAGQDHTEHFHAAEATGVAALGVLKGLLDGLSSWLRICISWDTLRHDRNTGDACLCSVVCCPA